MKKFIIVGAVSLGLAGVIGACTNTEEKPVQKVAEVPASTPVPKEEPKPQPSPSPDQLEIKV